MAERKCRIALDLVQDYNNLLSGDYICRNMILNPKYHPVDRASALISRDHHSIRLVFGGEHQLVSFLLTTAFGRVRAFGKTRRTRGTLERSGSDPYAPSVTRFCRSIFWPVSCRPKLPTCEPVM